MPVTRICFKDKKAEIVEKLQGLEKKDPSFKFTISGPYVKIYSDTMDKAFKRGLVLCKKYFKELGDFGFEVIRN